MILVVSTEGQWKEQRRIPTCETILLVARDTKMNKVLVQRQNFSSKGGNWDWVCLPADTGKRKYLSSP